MPGVTTRGCVWPRKWPVGNSEGRGCLQGCSPVRWSEALYSCCHRATWGQCGQGQVLPALSKLGVGDLGEANSRGVTPWKGTVPWWKENPSQSLGHSLRC